ncbi:DDE-type integrase/transposase/recombinase [Streptomyces sp. NPDC058664]|uniref:DDE-type integrase/transposase/recombinase n=1 Tax=unclassified Streptomyces TaxID=2593676 RepID=UPI003666BC2C
MNTKYVGDITYLLVEGGKFCYLATAIDLCSRRLAGWNIADHMRTALRPGPALRRHDRAGRRLLHQHRARRPAPQTARTSPAVG